MKCDDCAVAGELGVVPDGHEGAGLTYSFKVCKDMGQGHGKSLVGGRRQVTCALRVFFLSALRQAKL